MRVKFNFYAPYQFEIADNGSSLEQVANLYVFKARCSNMYLSALGKVGELCLQRSAFPLRS